VEKKMYITGSIGSELIGESFGKPYALPNATAYAETCAAISLAMFADRMLNITGDMKYADITEKAIYNGILSGISLSGDRYFYRNMLETNPRTTYVTQRQLWFNTSCCPTNFCRFLPQLGSYLWSESEEGVRLNIPAQSTFSSNGIRISVKGNYPYDGKIVITFESAGEFTFACRIPGWCRSYQVKLNGSVERINGNAPEWRRAWQEGDCIELELDMPIELVYSSTDVIEDIGKAAMCRGPLVYAVEVCDVNEELWRYVIDRTSLCLTPVNGLPGGTYGISGRALREKKRGDSLYTTVAPEYEEVTFTAVPYSLWQNRGPSTMQVWMRY
ncbi:MAG: glycoside hydrolase family 127 protein, partial [Lentisphaeria bacterium]|nr:glycoside hydrolase family 127 protein [Lentisphaeria bacterium]